MIDATNAKLLIAADDVLFRCELDGTACTSSLYTAGPTSYSFREPRAVIDTTNGNLLIVMSGGGVSINRVGLFICVLDGTNCRFVDVSAGHSDNSGAYPYAVIDVAQQKLLIAATNGDNQAKLALYRCELDGSSCTYSDVSAAPPSSGQYPSALVDTVSSKLLVVTESGAYPNAKPGLFRCNLDGSSCAFTDISAGQGAGCGFAPASVIDATDGKLLVVTDNAANGARPGLFRCNLDGTSCGYADISAGQGPESGMVPSIVLDGASGKLLVATYSEAPVDAGFGMAQALFSVGCLP